MRISIFAVLLAVAAVASAQTHNSTLVAWTDSTRDIYIDNELDRGAQVLTADSPSRLVLISTKLESAIVLDVSERIVKILAKDSFQFGDDHTSATSDPKSQRCDRRQTEMRPSLGSLLYVPIRRGRSRIRVLWRSRQGAKVNRQ